MFKRSFYCFLLCFSLLLQVFSFVGYAQNGENIRSLQSPPSVSAQSAILIEAESGNTVFEKQSDFPLPMASTTKIMTGLVALESASPDTLITISREAIGVEGSSLYLKEGEKLTLEQLLYALLLESANDAALAIAIGLCGSVDAFAQKMNEKAAQLGLTATHFVNPHGLDATEHYTTAKELALITRYALQNEKFAAIVSTRKITLPQTELSGARVLVNHNKLLRLYDGCIGVKTGFTKKSGRCLVSAAQKDGVVLIAVTLNAPDDWNDHASMFNYGFPLFSSVTLCKKNEFTVPLAVVGGADCYVMLSNREEITLTLPADYGKVTYITEMRHFEYAPVSKDTPLGCIRFFCEMQGEPQELATVALYADYDVEQYLPKRSLWGRILNFFGTLFGG